MLSWMPILGKIKEFFIFIYELRIRVLYMNKIVENFNTRVIIDFLSRVLFIDGAISKKSDLTHKMAGLRSDIYTSRNNRIRWLQFFSQILLYSTFFLSQLTKPRTRYTNNISRQALNKEELLKEFLDFFDSFSLFDFRLFFFFPFHISSITRKFIQSFVSSQEATGIPSLTILSLSKENQIVEDKYVKTHKSEWNSQRVTKTQQQWR